MVKPSIVAVLESYGAVNLPAWGGWRAIRCPFHNDRKASASVNPDDECFRCHACEIKGDAYAVVMVADGVDFAEAVKRVTEMTGTAYDDLRAGKRASKSKLPPWTKNRKRRKVFARA